MNKAFLINCDDLGMHETINDAICDLLSQGIIKSTSLMATGLAFDDAVEKLKRLKKYSCGVHLTLNSEYRKLATEPVLGAAVESLCDAKGYFLADPLQTKEQRNLEQVKNEFCAQIDKIIDTGIQLTHIDGHMFCYDPDVGGEKISALAKEVSTLYELPMRTLNLKNLKGIPRTNFIWESYDDQESRENYYREVLNSHSSVVEEIIIHPAKELHELSKFTGAGERRISDYRYFSSKEFRDIVISNDLKIIDWTELKLQTPEI